MRIEVKRRKQREEWLQELRKQGEKGLRSRKGQEGASVTGGLLRMGDVSCAIRTPRRPELVPDVAFVDIPQHMEILKEPESETNIR